MKKIRLLAPGEHYHIYNRGVMKRKTFLDDRDRARFLFLLLHFQGPFEPENLGRYVSYYLKGGSFKIDGNQIKKMLETRSVKLLAFALMPNHFHLIVEETKEGGISKYLQRIGNAYTKYFNTRYQTNGYLFQGKFKFRHIANNDQLLYTSAYVHRNCCELTDWQEKAELYPWSSYPDYFQNNRWPKLLAKEMVAEQFKTPLEYHDWIKNSGAKELEQEIDLENDFI